jgi:hypothetical protein
LLAALSWAVLDRSRSECDWQNDADAVEPGVFGLAAEGISLDAPLGDDQCRGSELTAHTSYIIRPILSVAL